MNNWHFCKAKFFFDLRRDALYRGLAYKSIRWIFDNLRRYLDFVRFVLRMQAIAKIMPIV